MSQNKECCVAELDCHFWQFMANGKHQSTRIQAFDWSLLTGKCRIQRESGTCLWKAQLSGKKAKIAGPSFEPKARLRLELFEKDPFIEKSNPWKIASRRLLFAGCLLPLNDKAKTDPEKYCMIWTTNKGCNESIVVEKRLLENKYTRFRRTAESNISNAYLFDHIKRSCKFQFSVKTFDEESKIFKWSDP